MLAKSPPENSYLASHHVLEKFGNFPFFFNPNMKGKKNYNDDFFFLFLSFGALFHFGLFKNGPAGATQTFSPDWTTRKSLM